MHLTFYKIIRLTKYSERSKNFFKLSLLQPLHSIGGRDSSAGIATGYGLDGSGIESRWRARFSAPVQTGPGAHPASCTGSFSGGKAAGAWC